MHYPQTKVTNIPMSVRGMTTVKENQEKFEICQRGSDSAIYHYEARMNDVLFSSYRRKSLSACRADMEAFFECRGIVVMVQSSLQVANVNEVVNE